MATNTQVVDHFCNKESGDLAGDTLLVENGVLYSYGLHWPLGVWVDDQVWINATRRSAKSTIHVGLLSIALTQRGITYCMKTMQEVKDQINAE